jgi:hypothetical protein
VEVVIPASTQPHDAKELTMRKQFVVVLILLGFIIGGCRAPEPTPVETESSSTTLPPPSIATSTPFAPDPTATETEASPTPLPSPTATTGPINYGPTGFPPNINPLTGLEVSDLALLDRRPLAIKVTLLPRSYRPQWGLSMADLVFEFYQNGGISRFHAIFLGNDVERVGPIRSARFPDANFIRMYKSVFAFGSADIRVLNRFSFAEFFPYLVSEFPAGCEPMCRVDPNGKDALVTNTENLSAYINQQGLPNGRQNLDGMRFANQVPTGGDTVNHIYVRYGPQIYNRWDYDPSTQKYLRFQDIQNDLNGAGEAYGSMVDQLNDQQIAADNVVIVLIPHEYFSRNPEIIEIPMGTSGDAYVYRDGRFYKVRWSVPTINSVLSLTNPDGSPFPFRPGNTWFQVIGTSSEITQPDSDTWRFQFRIP